MSKITLARNGEYLSCEGFAEVTGIDHALMMKHVAVWITEAHGNDALDDHEEFVRLTDYDKKIVGYYLSEYAVLSICANILNNRDLFDVMVNFFAGLNKGETFIEREEKQRKEAMRVLQAFERDLMARVMKGRKPETTH